MNTGIRNRTDVIRDDIVSPFFCAQIVVAQNNPMKNAMVRGWVLVREGPYGLEGV
jgi:hypothetical protein